MHRKKLLQLISNYQLSKCCFEEDLAIVKQFTQFILKNKTCFNRELEKGHITGSCFLLNTDFSKSLFTHHKKLNKWLQLGGHADGDYDILNVAIKEAKEESGIPLIKPLSEEIFDLDIHFIPENQKEKAHLHYDVRFLLQVEEEIPYSVSSESFDLKWISLDQFEKYNLDRSIIKMRTKFEQASSTLID